jgi:hypothetical protein
VVFKPGAAQAFITNLPPTESCGTPCHPAMHHFAAFTQLVDFRFVPEVALATFIPPPGGQAGPDYCPGAQV